MDTFLWVLTATFIFRGLSALHYVDEDNRKKAKPWTSRTFAMAAIMQLCLAVGTMIYGGVL